MRKISAKIGVTALSAFALFAVSIPQAYGSVNCNSPNKSLQGALDQASDGDTIKVVGGPCVENIVVKLDHVTLDGNGTATIDGSGVPASPTVTVLGTNVTITGFTITGGRRGILVTRGASAFITEVTVTNAVRSGIHISRSSTAKIFGPNCIVTLNGDLGIAIMQSSTADINNCTISENGRDGVQADKLSHADIDGSTIADNDRNGVKVGSLSVIALSQDGDPNTIVGNDAVGVVCGGISRLNVKQIQDFDGDPGQDPNGSNTSISGFPRCSLSNSKGDPEF